MSDNDKQTILVKCGVCVRAEIWMVVAFECSFGGCWRVLSRRVTWPAEQKLGGVMMQLGYLTERRSRWEQGLQSQAWPGRELLPRGTDRPERGWVCLSEETDYRRYLPWWMSLFLPTSQPLLVFYRFSQLLKKPFLFLKFQKPFWRWKEDMHEERL